MVELSELSYYRYCRITVGTSEHGRIIAECRIGVCRINEVILYNSIFGFTQNTTLLSYVPKKSKAVQLLSTMHSTPTIDEESGFKLKPEIVTFYNLTKGGVDMVNQMCGTYSVGRRTNRWPLCLFFDLLNVAGINSGIIFKSLNINSPRDHLKIRSQLKNLPRSLHDLIILHCKKAESPEIEMSVESEPKKRKRCYVCPSTKDSAGCISFGFVHICSFKQYLPNKPAKYGIRTYVLCCSRKSYVVNLDIYAGKKPEGPYQISNSPKNVVERLSLPISGSKRNITTDNWYTSYPLAVALLNEHKLTLVGTLKKYKKEIPPEYMPNRARQVFSSIFGLKKMSPLYHMLLKGAKVSFFYLQCTQQQQLIKRQMKRRSQK
ncbi:hypothetical protein LAZ67_11003685 [Cordylochernes scorpioides]|uniref:PiggyBac transposable element-derived protein domain-containing protein n=1 Tax=Cordylochernes scorpioides TaxID=51811 RepID=A0ABY6L039_9ARAC|nr:hypothetical protein LAZ67_11003685 [Cordylochernes scorpioides]